jgi:hypothetical protein
MKAFIRWIKWRVASRELRELERWQVQYQVLRRWLAEFPNVAATLDHMQNEAVGTGTVVSVHDLRAAMRAADRADLVPALQDVIAERHRQVSVEGWTPAHDDQYQCGDLASAAACYANQGRIAYPVPGSPPPSWPWWPGSWKPKDHRSNLVRAGALILAEIERYDRASASSKGK